MVTRHYLNPMKIRAHGAQERETETNLVKGRLIGLILTPTKWEGDFHVGLNQISGARVGL